MNALILDLLEDKCNSSSPNEVMFGFFPTPILHKAE